jgi:hypothetical protein
MYILYSSLPAPHNERRKSCPWLLAQSSLPTIISLLRPCAARRGLSSRPRSTLHSPPLLNLRLRRLDNATEEFAASPCLAPAAAAQPTGPALQSLPGAHSNWSFVPLAPKSPPTKIERMVRRRLEHVRQWDSGSLPQAIMGKYGGHQQLILSFDANCCLD